jgi:hypothetical protein
MLENLIIDFVANCKEPVNLDEVTRQLGLSNNTVTRTNVTAVLRGAGLVTERAVLWDKDRNKAVNSTVVYPAALDVTVRHLDLEELVIVLANTPSATPVKDVLDKLDIAIDSINQRAFVALARLLGYTVRSKTYYDKDLKKAVTQLQIYTA